MKSISIALVTSVVYVSVVKAFTSCPAIDGVTVANQHVFFLSNENIQSSESCSSSLNRRGMFQAITSQAVSTAAFLSVQQEALAAQDEVIMYKTQSGLQYREIVEGTGPSPEYGKLVTFSYKGYVSLAGDSKDKKPAKFDEVRSFLTKHGNGRLIAGLDEGLHTMKVGGIRRLFIPPKLGYVESGVGPIPEGWLARRTLNGLLDDLIARQGGRIIFDIELIAVRDDEADQGYYDDDSPTPEEFATLRMNMQGSGSSGSGQDPVVIDN